MRTLVLTLVVLLGFVMHADARPRSGGGSRSSRASSGSHGTGSSSSTRAVRGYTKRNGTHVAPHRATKPDRTQRNNYSAKGNYNPHTGKTGTRSVSH